MLQVPGGPELLIVLLVLFVLFGPVVLAVVALVKYTDDGEAGDDRVDELEARVAELEQETARTDAPADEATVESAAERAGTNDGTRTGTGDGAPVETDDEEPTETADEGDADGG